MSTISTDLLAAPTRREPGPQPGTPLGRVYDLPVKQVRAELEALTDTAFAQRHGIGRTSASKLRRELGVPPHPQGRQTTVQEVPA